MTVSVDVRVFVFRFRFSQTPARGPNSSLFNQSSIHGSGGGVAFGLVSPAPTGASFLSGAPTDPRPSGFRRPAPEHRGLSTPLPPIATLEDDFDFRKQYSSAKKPQQTPWTSEPRGGLVESRLFDAKTPDPQFRAAALIGASAAVSSLGQRDEDSVKWVTVFGYPLGADDAVREYFAASGRIHDVKYTPHNRIHIGYTSESDYQTALAKNGASDVVPGFLIGVKPCAAQDLPHPFADASTGVFRRREVTRVNKRVRSRTPGAVGRGESNSLLPPGDASSIYKKPQHRRQNMCSRVCEYVVRLVGSWWQGFEVRKPIMMTSASPRSLLLFLTISGTLSLLPRAHAHTNTRISRYTPNEVFQVYANIHQLMTDGNHAAVVAAVDAALDSGLPDVCPEGIPISSLSFMKGMALYGMGRIHPAQEAFAAAVMAVPRDRIAWSNFGDLFLFDFQLDNAIWAYDTSWRLSNSSDALGKLYKAKTWSCDWQGLTELHDAVVAAITSDGGCSLRKPIQILATDFLDAPLDCVISMSAGMNRAIGRTLPMDAFRLTPSQPVYYPVTTSQIQLPKLTVGFVSSDFGIHPVVTLIRGLVSGLDKHRFNVICYSLHDEESWWSQNISQSVSAFRWLSGFSTQEAVQRILDDGVDVLIDLNGHTLRTGLPLFTYKPALVQLTFLGYPLTTALPYIDHVIVDHIAYPPHVAKAHTEKFVYMPNSFFVNDYKTLQDHIPLLPRPRSLHLARHVVHSLVPVGNTTQANGAPTNKLQSVVKLLPVGTLVLASFSNYQKVDPFVADVWCNVLRRLPHAVFWILKHHADEFAEPNLLREFLSRGIPRSRIIVTDKSSWIEHIRLKMAADIVLDTVVKNGHTSSADALWAGVPAVSLAGKLPHARVTASLLSNAGYNANVTLAVSAKDYEDIVVRMGSSHKLLSAIRTAQAKQRITAPLFDTHMYTRDFERKLHQLLDLCLSSTVTEPGILRPKCTQLMHVYATQRR